MPHSSKIWPLFPKAFGTPRGRLQIRVLINISEEFPCFGGVSGGQNDEVLSMTLFCSSYLKKKYFADFLCFNEVVIELKAVSELTNIHKGQLFNYLKASEKRLGVLVNFGPEKLEYKRFIL